MSIYTKDQRKESETDKGGSVGRYGMLFGSGDSDAFAARRGW